MAEFIPGLTLSGLFYEEVVRPLWETHFSHIPYSAALVGSGSEILGFDTSQSSDHHWGPRLMVFLSDAEYEQQKDKIIEFFRYNLPYTFRGISTNFGSPDNIGVQLLEKIDSGPVNHRIELFTIRGFFEDYFGFDPRQELGVFDWLTLPEQRLLTVTSGRVYHDGLGDLQRIRETLRYYPDDVWRYLLAAQWNRISQEEAFVGRCGDVGDDVGSHIIATRLVRDVMKLCFFMERQYAPYNKWFGSAFSRLDCAEKLIPMFTHIFQATSWKERESHLSQVYQHIASMHNALNITVPSETQVRPYYGRPYNVIHADHFAEAIRSSIQDEQLRAIKEPIGSIDQFIDSTEIVSIPELFRRLKVMYTQ